MPAVAMEARHSNPPYVSRHGTLDGYAVWLVDGAVVRRDINPNFTNVDQHFHIRQIPQGEIWIDSATKEPEIGWLAKDGVKEARLMADGESYARAEGVAERMDRAMRKNDPGQHARVQIAKWGDNGKLRVFLVKGRVVRDKFRDSFTEGGHDRVYPWMPKKTIYLDDATTPEDRPFNFLHEIYEWNRMGDGLNYAHAHHEALEVELEARRHPERYRALLDAQMKRAGGDLGIEKIAEFRKLMGR